MHKFVKNRFLVLCIYVAIFVITINAYAFTNSDDINTSSFIEELSDIHKDDWFYSSVNYVVQNKLMNGTSDTTFSPHDYMTRGMFVTVLWRIEGEPLPQNTLLYNDVSAHDYFYEPIIWASSNEIVNGYNKISFGPGDCITREQLVTILYRYCSNKEINLHSNASLENFNDEKTVSEYAYLPIKWAVGNDLITGVSADVLAPERYASRAECAAIINRFYQKFILPKNSVVKDIEKDIMISKDTGKSNYHSSSFDDNQDTVNKETIDREPANDAVSIAVGSISAIPGESFQLPVAVSNNPGIIGMILTVSYDENNLTLQSISNGEAFDGILNMTVSKNLSSGVRIIWDGLNVADDKIKDGNILYLNFNVSDDAIPGDYPIQLSFSKKDIVDNNLNSVSLTITNGNVTIIEK